jgi:hypothetical protein
MAVAGTAAGDDDGGDADALPLHLSHTPGMMGMPSLKWSDLKNSCTMWFD